MSSYDWHKLIIIADKFCQHSVVADIQRNKQIIAAVKKIQHKGKLYSRQIGYVFPYSATLLYPRFILV